MFFDSLVKTKKNQIMLDKHEDKVVHESLRYSINVSNDTLKLSLIFMYFTVEHLPTVAEADDRRDFPHVPQAPHLLALDEDSVAYKNKNIIPLSKIHVFQRQEESQRSCQATASSI